MHGRGASGPPNGTPSTGTQNLVAAIAGNALFASLDEVVITSILEQMEWFSLPGGRTLFRQGDPANALYLVTSGCLAVVMRHVDGRETKVAQVHAGETVGEMALISGEPRSATVIAMRDSSLLRISRESFEGLIRRHPDAMFHLSKQLVARVISANRAAAGAATGTAKTIALLPTEPGLACESLARDLSVALSDCGKRAFVLDTQAAGRTAEWFHRLEQAHDLILYCAEPTVTSWTRLCLRQADRVLLVARSRPDPGAAPPAEDVAEIAAQRGCDLVVVHDARDRLAQPLAPGWAALPVDLHCHLRPGNASDRQRLARILTGQAVGLVLSSGGARGFAHVGVVRALRRAGIPLDLLGGTSMGAVVAASVALEWDDDELEARLRQSFVTAKPLRDYTIPLIALARGQKVTRLLREHFGERAFEQLWRPCFAVSSNLTSARTRVHRAGPIWRALRASVAIPGLLPPVVDAGEVLVDGGVIDGFPIGTMRALHQGPLIGVNVSGSRALDDVSDGLETGSPWWKIRHRGGDAPGIVSLLMRAGTVSSEAQTRAYREQVDLLLEPPAAGVDLLDWGAFDRAIELGYAYTMRALEDCDLATLRP